MAQQFKRKKNEREKRNRYFGEYLTGNDNTTNVTEMRFTFIASRSCFILQKNSLLWSKSERTLQKSGMNKKQAVKKKKKFAPFYRLNGLG